MFERFNEQGRQVVVLAQDEARSLGHGHIGSEHILLGLLRLDDDLVEVLGDLDDARRRVVELVGEGEQASPGQIPFTPNGKRTLELAASESSGSMIGPWQLALALLSLPSDATALRALRALGVDIAEARDEIIGLRDQLPAHDDASGGLSAESRRVLETAARHAEDAALGPEHLLLGLVLEVPELTRATIGTSDGGIVHERLAGLLDGPEPSRLQAPRRDIAVLEAALRYAAQVGQDEVSPAEIMLGLLEVAPDVVARAAVDLDAVAARTRRFGPPFSNVRGVVRRPSELPGGPLSLFSPGARDMLRCALGEAQRLDHGSIGTEHLLLALIQDEQGVAGRVLSELQVRLGEARARVEHIVPRGDEHHIAGSAAGQIGFTPGVTRSFGQALREMAVRDGATEIDTGDILLAIEQDGEGVAVQVLEQLGAPRALVRQRTLAALRGDASPLPAGRLTPSARRALLLADAEANALGHTWVGCEHLLLALARQDGPAAEALSVLEISVDSVHGGLADLGGSIGFGDPVRTPRLIRSIETAEQIAGASGRAQADDGDLLLGLARESTGLARELLGPEATEQALRAALGR